MEIMWCFRKTILNILETELESILEVMAPVRTTGNTVAQGTVVSTARTLGAEGETWGGSRQSWTEPQT